MDWRRKGDAQRWHNSDEEKGEDVGEMQREREKMENVGCVLFNFGYLIVLLWLPGVLHQLILAGCSDAIALCCARVPQNTKNSPVNLPSVPLSMCVCL